jgi:hypothetical protein
METRKNKCYKELQEWWESGDEQFDVLSEIFNSMYQAGRDDQVIIDNTILKNFRNSDEVEALTKDMLEASKSQ